MSLFFKVKFSFATAVMIKIQSHIFFNELEFLFPSFGVQLGCIDISNMYEKSSKSSFRNVCLENSVH